jgi:hypothetical protein
MAEAMSKDVDADYFSLSLAPNLSFSFRRVIFRVDAGEWKRRWEEKKGNTEVNSTAKLPSTPSQQANIPHAIVIPTHTSAIT